MSRKNKLCFNLRLSRVIPSFNLCRSKQKLINPIHSFPRPLPGHPAPARLSYLSPNVSPAVCGCRRSYTPDPDDFSWRKDDTWHVVTKTREYCASPPRQKIYTSAASRSNSDDDDLASTPPLKMKHRQVTMRKLKIRVSTSSVDTCAMFFSMDDDRGEETEQLISTDETSSDRRGAHSRIRSIKTRPRKSFRDATTLSSPPRLSVLRRLTACRVEGKVRGSLAVVKRSENPFEDFKRSMMDMIVEKELFDEAELQQLLECFLSLNSKHHYPTIVGAFSEVWETLFCKNNN